MNTTSITDRPHNDLVGGDASIGRIPGADAARTGHHYEAISPKDGHSGKYSDAPRRPQEHIPPPTGRDAPPSGGVPPLGPNISAVIPGEEHTTTRTLGNPSPPPHIPPKGPLAPAPDSRTVVDPDPWAERTSVGDTLGGVTSQDVHRGYGHPGAGMTSAEMHHNGQKHRKRQGQGTATYGSGAIPRDIDVGES